MTEIEFRNNSTVELIQSNATDDMVAMAAWVSNGLNDEARLADTQRVKGLINFLWREQHHSPFEHGQFTFKITTPLFVMREVQRHRTSSFNEASGRYSILPSIYYVPDPNERPMIQAGKIGSYRFEMGSPELQQQVNLELQEAAMEAQARYDRLLALGAAREVARVALTIGLFTESYMTVNPRNLMHFLDLRTDAQALYEIRDVADQMEVFLKDQMPLTYEARKTNKE